MLNHASRTRFPVGRVLVPAGVFKRRFLNSPAMIWIIPDPSPPTPMRNGECGMRNNTVRSYASRRSPGNSAFRTPHSAFSSFRVSLAAGCQRGHPRLEGEPTLPLVQLQPEGHVERLAQPAL